jgi:hypothetical protein
MKQTTEGRLAGRGNDRVGRTSPGRRRPIITADGPDITDSEETWGL